MARVGPVEFGAYGDAREGGIGDDGFAPWEGEAARIFGVWGEEL